MTPGSAPAPLPSAAALCGELDTAFLDPELLEEGDTAPSEEALSTAKHLVEKAQGLLATPIAHPHIEFFDSTIRLTWKNGEANVLLVIASSNDRPSYIYHASIGNGQVGTHGTVAPTAPNLAHWLAQMQ